jgi:hypothetical protein
LRRPAAYVSRKKGRRTGRRVGQGEGIAVQIILGLGIFNLALGILVMAPISLAMKKNELMSKAMYLLFQVCTAVGLAGVLAAGALLMTV